MAELCLIVGVHPMLTIDVLKRQYFLMPLTFLQECDDSTGIHRNLLEWDRNPQESTGMRLDSTGMTLFLQEWNILNKIAYIYINAIFI